MLIRLALTRLKPHMISTTVTPPLGRTKVMREYEFSRDETVLTKDDVWLRLFARVAPNVRRDIIGWLGLASPAELVAPAEASETFSEKCRDYFAGASLVIDPLPNRPYDFCTNDREALAGDVEVVSLDMKCLYETLSRLDHRISHLERPTRRTGRPEPAAARGGANKSSAAA